MNRIEENIRKSGDYYVGENGVAIINNTFYSDFTIADHFGKSAIKDTYRRAFRAWKEDIDYIVALSIALNHKGWSWWERDKEVGKLYFELWEELEHFVFEEKGEEYKNYTKEELNYYIRALD